MNKEMNELKKEYQDVKAPESGKQKVMDAMNRAEKEKNENKIRSFKLKGIAAAAALAVLVALPNTTAGVAMAMENIPIVGGFFKVVTFRNYEYKDENNFADVNVPQIEPGEKDKNIDSIKSVNKSVEEYTNQLIETFESDMEMSDGQGHTGLEVTHDIITDTENWFTLRINVFEVQASGYQQYKYYHIDKRTDQVVSLSDLFTDNSDYITVISTEIKKQMHDNMKEDENNIYFLDSEMPESDFHEILPEQNFYFNTSGQLVISFDEYEVAPGYMGAQEFVIPNDVIDEL